MDTQRFITLANETASPITVTWNSTPYTFEPDEVKTVDLGVGLFFKEKAPGLTIVARREGAPVDGIFTTDVIVTNEGAEPVELTWQGTTYSFAAGESRRFDAGVADGLMIQAAAAEATMTLANVEGTTSLVIEPPEEE